MNTGEIFGLCVLLLIFLILISLFFAKVINDFNEDTKFWRFCCIIPGINIIMFIVFFLIYLPIKWALKIDNNGT